MNKPIPITREELAGLIAQPHVATFPDLPTCAPPRPLTADEQIRVKCLRKFFTEARAAVERMVPEKEPRYCCHREYTLWKLDQAEHAAVKGLEDAMREGR